MEVVTKTSSIRKILIDLNINSNLINFFDYTVKEVRYTLNNIKNIYTTTNLSDDMSNDIGHSHSFMDILQRGIDTFSSEQTNTLNDYIHHETVDLSKYTIWKPIMNRSVNYDNEPILLNNIKDEFMDKFSTYAQYIHYYSSIFYGSITTDYKDKDDLYSIDQEDPNSKVENYYKGVVNFMSLREKKHLLEGFTLNHFLFQKLYFFFSHMINRVTIRNERLDEIRNQFKLIYIILENINTLFVNAVYELELLISEEYQELLVRNPFRSERFISLIGSLVSRLSNLQTEINTLFVLLGVDMRIPLDTVSPDSPTVIFPNTGDGERLVSVELPPDSDAIAWEYSIDGTLFLTGSNFKNMFSLTPGVTYYPGEIQVRSKDASHNYSETVTNSDTIMIQYIPPSPPIVTFPSDNTSSVISVLLQDDDVSVAWEISTNNGNFFVTGNDTIFYLLPGTTYKVNQIHIRSRDAFYNYSTIVSNLNSIETPL